jgi:hypothetical protein
MHIKIDRKREELQMKLDQLDRQIEENKARWKLFLKNQIETKVGCVLTELLQNYEIDESKFNKARLDFISSKKLFHLFHHQQLISINYNEEKQTDFSSPWLDFSSVVSNDLNWMKNFSSENLDERIKWLDHQEIYMSEKSTYKINSSEYD